MTEEMAREEIPNVNVFCKVCCNFCMNNDWYCPSECAILEKARKLDFNRIIKCYMRHEGDLGKVLRYIKSAKINRAKGGY